MNEVGEVKTTEVADSASQQAVQKQLISLESREPPWDPVACNLCGDEILTATAAVDAKEKVPQKVITSRVRGSVKWFNVKNGYSFISRRDTQEDVFVHQTAITRNNPHKYQHSVGDGEIVKFNVVQGEPGTKAANVTGPAGAPVQGSCYAANRPHFRRGFHKNPHVLTQQDTWDHEHHEDDDKESSKIFNECVTMAQGPQFCLPRGPQDQGLWCFSPFCTAQVLAHYPLLLPPTSDLRVQATEREGGPHQRPCPSYLLSHPRGRGTAPAPQRSPVNSEKLEAENKESGHEVGHLLQRFPATCGSHFSNNPGCSPKQAPDIQGKKPQGGESKTI